MSHYTTGTGSSPELQNIANAANRTRSQTYRDAFTAFARILRNKRNAHRTLPGAAPEGGV